jgi:hypothetical protein
MPDPSGLRIKGEMTTTSNQPRYASGLEEGIRTGVPAILALPEQPDMALARRERSTKISAQAAVMMANAGSSVAWRQGALLLVWQ